MSKSDFHTLCHSHATMILEEDAPIIDIKDRLGHVSLKTSLKYFHDTEKIRSKTNQVLDRMYKDTEE